MPRATDTIENAVRGVNLKGFNGIDVVKLLRYTSEFDRIGKDGHFDKLMAVKLLIKCFFDTKRFVFHSNGSTLCLAFVTAMERNDIRAIRRDILNLGVPFDTVTQQLKPTVNWFLWPTLLIHLVSWTRSLSSTSLDRDQKAKTLNALLTSFSLLKFTSKHMRPGKYSLLTVFYDADPVHNMLVQMFRNEGVQTATLQHGIILAPRAGATDNIDFAGVELTGSVSDFFLAWNNFTKREALKAGIREECIRVLGITRCLSVPNSACRFKESVSPLFGVLLDGRFTQHNNPDMIAIANELCAKLKMRYRLRYHPNYTSHEYDALVDWNVCDGVSPKSENLMAFADQVRFTILANSTALIELTYAGYSTQVYSAGTVYDKFRDADICRFRTVSELENLITHEPPNLQTFEELCTVRDIAGAYTSFFKSFLQHQ